MLMESCRASADRARVSGVLRTILRGSVMRCQSGVHTTGLNSCRIQHVSPWSLHGNTSSSPVYVKDCGLLEGPTWGLKDEFQTASGVASSS